MESEVDFEKLFGVAYKGIPIVTSVAIALSNVYDINLPYSFGRKESKSYGEKGIIVGGSVENKKILLIDDVITSGIAIRESMDSLNCRNIKVAGILVALDRQEKGSTGNISATKELELKYGCKVIAITNFTSIISYMKKQKNMESKVKAMCKYQLENSVVEAENSISL